MCSVIWLARIYGPLLIVFGAWLFVFSNEIHKSIANTKHHCDTCNLVGFFNLFLGLIVLSLYNTWSMERSVLLTILGWVLIVRGLLLLFTQHLIAKSLLKRHTMTKIIAVIIFFWGLAIFSLVL